MDFAENFSFVVQNNVLSFHSDISQATLHLYTVYFDNEGKIESLKVVSATFLLVCFLCLQESIYETRKNVFYFTSKALFVLEIIKF